MGALFSRIRDAFNSLSKLDASILMLGLDAAGKTTILGQLMAEDRTPPTFPTVGFNVEIIEPVKNVSFTVWDVGGQDKIRPLWKHYFHGCDGLIYVVDSADPDRFDEARRELEWVLEDDEMRGVPVVVLANKQDLPNAKTSSDVGSALGLTSNRKREWYIQGTCAVSGDGIYEGIHKLSTMVKEFKKRQSS